MNIIHLIVTETLLKNETTQYMKVPKKHIKKICIVYNKNSSFLQLRKT